MKYIKLSQGKSAMVDDEDYNFLSQWKWCAMKTTAGFYAVRSDYSTSKRLNVLMHRLIMNPPTGIKVDHKNGDTLCNLRSNLRICSDTQNGMNKGKRKTSKNKYKGISFNKKDKRWRAMIQVDKKNTYLGNFLTEELAAYAYNIAAQKYYGEFARLNEIIQLQEEQS